MNGPTGKTLGELDTCHKDLNGTKDELGRSNMDIQKQKNLTLEAQAYKT